MKKGEKQKVIMIKYKHSRAQSTVEYAALIAIVAGALITMQGYMKRGLQGKYKESTDSIGASYNPKATTILPPNIGDWDDAIYQDLSANRYVKSVYGGNITENSDAKTTKRYEKAARVRREKKAPDKETYDETIRVNSGGNVGGNVGGGGPQVILGPGVSVNDEAAGPAATESVPVDAGNLNIDGPSINIDTPSVDSFIEPVVIPAGSDGM